VEDLRDGRKVLSAQEPQGELHKAGGTNATLPGGAVEGAEDEKVCQGALDMGSINEYRELSLFRFCRILYYIQVTLRVR